MQNTIYVFSNEVKEKLVIKIIKIYFLTFIVKNDENF